VCGDSVFRSTFPEPHRVPSPQGVQADSVGSSFSQKLGASPKMGPSPKTSTTAEEKCISGVANPQTMDYFSERNDASDIQAGDVVVMARSIRDCKRSTNE